MRLSWLEELCEDGHITKEAKQKIYKNCEYVIEKKAGTALEDTMMALRKMIAKAMSSKAAPAIASGGSAAGTGAALAALINKMDNSHDREKAIVINRAAIMENPAFSGNMPKAEARFNEIARHAPSVAANLPMAEKLVASKLNSGLSDSDVNRLAVVQIVSMKTAAVSPEKLGEMLADSFIMTKMAFENGGLDKYAGLGNFLSNIGKKMTKGMDKDTVKYLKTISIVAGVPFALGLGGGAAKMVHQKYKDSQLKDQLENSYRKAMIEAKKSGNPSQLEMLEDKDGARKAFQALAHFAPNVALQPEAARAFMSKLVSYDQGIMTSDLKDLTQVEANIVGSREEHPFTSGFKAVSDPLGLKNVTSKGFESAAKSFVP